MNIDWFTLIVQILNFIILILILKSIIFKPLMDIIESRKKEVNGSLENAQKQIDESNKMREKIQEEYKNIEKYKQEEREKVDKELLEYKNNELNKIKEDFENKKNSLNENIEKEKEKIVEDISKNICNQIGKFADDIFKKLSNSSLKQASFDAFMEELRDLDDTTLNKIENLNKEEIEFYSNFELEEKEKEKVKTFFKGHKINNEISFKLSNKLIFGYKVIIGNMTINSNVEDVIEQFNNKIKSTTL